MEASVVMRNTAERFGAGVATVILPIGLGATFLSSLLVSQLHSRLTTSLVSQGLPHAQASSEASKLSQAGAGSRTGSGKLPHFVQLDFAYATRSVLHAMAAIMVVATVVAFVGLKRGVQTETEAAPSPVEV